MGEKGIAVLVREAVVQTVDRLGGAKQVPERLKRLGVVNPETGDAYSLGTVYAWMKGTNRPPVDVVFALTREAALDLNQLVFHGRVRAYDPRLEDVLAAADAFQEKLDDFRATLGKQEN